jgi:hypothetical protein
MVGHSSVNVAATSPVPRPIQRSASTNMSSTNAVPASAEGMRAICSVRPSACRDSQTVVQA